MSIIEQLKAKKEPFGMWTDEEQREANLIGYPNFEVYHNKEWRQSQFFDDDFSFRLHCDYREEPERKFKYYEIFPNENNTGYEISSNSRAWATDTSRLTSMKGFVGFLGEDGKITSEFYYYWDTKLEDKRFSITPEELESGEVVVKRAIKAVFLKD